jgi:hypothetical protein
MNVNHKNQANHCIVWRESDFWRIFVENLNYEHRSIKIGAYKVGWGDD